jgi:hypothetical protein
MRYAVISDWEFFPDDHDWLSLWARRYGESAVHALADGLRGTNWRLEATRQAADGSGAYRRQTHA